MRTRAVCCCVVHILQHQLPTEVQHAMANCYHKPFAGPVPLNFCTKSIFCRMFGARFSLLTVNFSIFVLWETTQWASANCGQYCDYVGVSGSGRRTIQSPGSLALPLHFTAVGRPVLFLVGLTLTL